MSDFHLQIQAGFEPAYRAVTLNDAINRVVYSYSTTVLLKNFMQAHEAVWLLIITRAANGI